MTRQIGVPRMSLTLNLFLPQTSFIPSSAFTGLLLYQNYSFVTGFFFPPIGARVLDKNTNLKQNNPDHLPRCLK